MLYLRIAWRNLFRNTRRTVLTGATLAFAVAFIIVTLTFLNGMASSLEEDMLASTGHLRVINARYAKKQRLLSLRYSVENAQVLRRRIAGCDNVKDVRFAVTFGATFINGDKNHPAVLRTLDVESAYMRRRFSDALVAGDFQKLFEPVRDTSPRRIRRLYMGKELADEFGHVKVGTVVTLVVQTREATMAAGDFRVEGVFDLGARMFNRMLWVPFADVDDLLMMKGGATSIMVFAADGRNISSLKREIAGLIPDDCIVQAWTEIGGLSNFLSMHYFAGALFFALILLIAAVCVGNTMVMVLFERTREIGVLGALGFSRMDILLVFAAESLLLGLCSIVPGMLVGGLLSLYLVYYGVALGSSADAVFAVRDIVYGELGWSTFTWAFSLGLIVSLLSTVWPVFRATRIEAAAALSSH